MWYIAWQIIASCSQKLNETFGPSSIPNSDIFIAQISESALFFLGKIPKKRDELKEQKDPLTAETPRST